jgi:alpha-ribazole phosphatase/probable phosphoglycerate mutase
MEVDIVYFVHGTTTDNQDNRATGHASGKLSELGVQQANDLGDKVEQEFDAVYSSDLRRALKSAKLAFGDKYEIRTDERLRECDYGEMTQSKFTWDIKDYIETSYPNGESYRDVEKRMNDFLRFLRENNSGDKVALVAHQAPQLALEVLTKDKTWEEAIEDDWRENGEWQPGWIYRLD